jgi:hypothetical protein
LSSQGPNFAGSASTAYASAGTATWTNDTDIESNGAFATCAPSAATSKSLDGFAFGFSIPGGATVVGFEVTIVAKYSHISGANNMTLAGCQLAVGGATGTPTTTNPTGDAVTTSAATYTYGGATDLWGIASGDWTVSNVNSAVEGTGPTFSVWLSSTGANQADVQAMQATIYYTAAGGPPVTLARGLIATQAVMRSHTW